MLNVLLQLGYIVDIVNLAVHANAHIAVLADLFQELPVLPFPGAHGGGNDLHAPFPHGHHLVHHLVDCLASNGLAAFGAVRFSHASIEQAQVIMNLRNRAHGGAGIVGGALLIDTNCRRKPLDVVHIGLFHLAQKLAGIRGEGFHIPSLTLGIDGIKGQGRFPTARKPRKHDKFIARQRKVDIL
ncbi:hypothetical protein SDC9_130870 [bioreactor metagenome]|uniref:Uncharacterized protein n=1 Tax=bioreactor metagenome TaxID=1076179 RepID=A0A645D3Q3_9ZZZZ